MTVSYVDTSAVMKLVVREPESAVLREGMASGRRLVASWLLHTELHCAAGRHPSHIDLALVQRVLDTVGLTDLSRGDLLAAAAHAPLRANDAIHLAVALRLEVDEIVTYDAELAAAATAAGLAVFAPAV